ncbi:MAG: amidase [Rhodospirillaceae bacterium]|nr:amidase [Rhodospirillaceae bacterium]
MNENWHMTSAIELGLAIEKGYIDPRELTEYFLDRISKLDPHNKIYLRTTTDRARTAARSAFSRSKSGLRLSILDGVPISWKDLFDTNGDITSHGSPILINRIAKQDAIVVERAELAGLVCLGKTNQTEYAFSILGLNPHFGTPSNPFDNVTERLPGGSTSGGAVSVSSGLAAAAIGSDTGGSVRVPSAWNGLVGLKTSFGRLPLQGVLPLSTSLDTVGPLTRNVDDAAAIFSILDGKSSTNVKPWINIFGISPKLIQLVCPKGFVWEKLTPDIESVTINAIEKISSSGVTITTKEVKELSEVDSLINHFGPYHASECHAIWGSQIENNPNLVYPPILERIRLGGKMTASSVEQIKNKLQIATNSLHGWMKEHGILVCPTVPITPPSIKEVEKNFEFWKKTNSEVLRNTRLGNFLNCCAITLPCGKDNNGIPIGLMLMAPWGDDELLLEVAATIERILNS